MLGQRQAEMWYYVCFCISFALNNVASQKGKHLKPVKSNTQFYFSLRCLMQFGIDSVCNWLTWKIVLCNSCLLLKFPFLNYILFLCGTFILLWHMFQYCNLMSFQVVQLLNKEKHQLVLQYIHNNWENFLSYSCHVKYFSPKLLYLPLKK